MIGLTIGTGDFAEVAERAAETFRRHTGLDCIVLGDEHYDENVYAFPHHLKYDMWRHVPPEHDRVVYFDADLWWFHDWDPGIVPAGRLGVVRDMTQAAHIVKDAQGHRLDVLRYFNSGLMIMDRSHAHLLTVARNFYDMYIAEPFGEFKSKFKDQTSLNAAVQLLDLDVEYLPRIYNWVQSSAQWAEAGVPVIGMHKTCRTTTGSDIITSFDAFRDRRVTPDGVVSLETYDRLAGDYRYTRMGYGSPNTVKLCRDGVVQGAGRLEHWWIPYDDGRMLIGGLATNNSITEYITMELHRVTDGRWEGKWLVFEGMPVTLERI